MLRKLLRTACVVCALLCAGPRPAMPQEDLPSSFKFGPNGGLTCVGAIEDACAFYDILPVPSGDLYLVQGSYSRLKNPTGKPSADAAEYTNFYFALLCTRTGDTLSPSFNFLEGGEHVSDIHLHDLNGDGTPEVIVTAVLQSEDSYAAVYRVDAEAPERIFYREANTPQTDFETDHGSATLVFEQRDPGEDGVQRREIFLWNGQDFVLEL